MEQQKTPEIISVRVRKKAVQHKASFISNGSNTQLKSQGYRNHLKIGRKKCREEKTTYNLRWIEPRKNMYTIVARFFCFQTALSITSISWFQCDRLQLTHTMRTNTVLLIYNSIHFWFTSHHNRIKPHICAAIFEKSKLRKIKKRNQNYEIINSVRLFSFS